MVDKLFNVFGVVAIAGTMVYAQDAQSPAGRPSQPMPSAAQAQQADQSITGCLTQGSGPTVFLLENAKLASDAASAASSAADRSSASDRSAPTAGAGRTYVVTAASAAADLKGQLNKQVTIVGTLPASAPSSSSGAAPPASASSPSSSSSAAGQAASAMNEQNLPRITAKSIVKVADTCAG